MRTNIVKHICMSCYCEFIVNESLSSNQYLYCPYCGAKDHREVSCQDDQIFLENMGCLYPGKSERLVRDIIQCELSKNNGFTPEKLGKKIAELRKKMNMTQDDLAKIVGMSKASVAMWELGNRDPDSGMLVTLADVFKVSTDYLLGRTDER